MSVVAQDLYGDPPTPEVADLWAEYLELTYPVLADTDGAFWDTWNPEGILPIAYVIDPEGVIVYAKAGGGPNELTELEETIDGLLEDP